MSFAMTWTAALPLMLMGRQHGLDRHLLLVQPDEPGLAGRNRHPLFLHLMHPGGRPVPEVGVNEIEGLPAKQLSRAGSAQQDDGCRVHVDDAAGLAHEDSVGRGLYQRPVPFFTFPELLFEAFPLRHVAHDREPARGRPRPVGQHRDGRLDVSPGE